MCIVTEHIAVKRAFTDDDEGVHNKYRIFDLLNSKPNCPNVVQSFYRIPSANFLQYLSGRTLDKRLRQRQTRNPANEVVIKVGYKEPESVIWRWMAKLIDGIAWLESWICSW